MIRVSAFVVAIMLWGAIFFSRPASGQTPMDAASPNDCAVAQNCAVDGFAVLAALPDTAAVALADSLGDDAVAVLKMLRANAYIRIVTAKSDADFLIASLPEFPATLVLINNQKLYAFDGRTRRYDGAEAAIAGLFNAVARQPGFWADRVPTLIGDLDERGTAAALNAEVQNFIWARRLLAFRNQRSPAAIAAATPVTGAVVAEGDADRRRFSEPFSLTVSNAGPDAHYFAVVQVDERWQVTKLLPWGNELPELLPAGGSNSYQDDSFVREALLDHHYVTISSPRPIDLRLLAPRSGTVAAFPRDWQIAVVSTKKPGVGYGGGGEAADVLTVPWQVQLYSTKNIVPPSFADNRALSSVRWHNYENTHRCGGSLIAPKIVLTAAHCLANAPFKGTAAEQTALTLRRVKLGTQNLQFGGTTYAIDAIVIHKGYVAGQNHHDIALVRLKEDRSTRAPPAAAARPIELASAPPAAGLKVDWTGWGAMEESNPGDTRLTADGTAQRYPAVLRTGAMQAIDITECKKRSGYGHVTPMMLCAVTDPDSEAARRGEHIFTCRNDSGGPITAVEAGKQVLVGVISWAVGCGVKDNPSVSVNVYRYLRWIDEAKRKFVAGRSARY